MNTKPTTTTTDAKPNELNIHSEHPPMPPCDHDECGVECKHTSAYKEGWHDGVTAASNIFDRWYRENCTTAGATNAIELSQRLFKEANMPANEAKKNPDRLTCFACGDGSTPLYCLNCAGEKARQTQTPIQEPESPPPPTPTIRPHEQQTALERVLRSYLYHPQDALRRMTENLPKHARRKEYREFADCQDAIRKAEREIGQWEYILSLYEVERWHGARSHELSALYNELLYAVARGAGGAESTKDRP